MGPYCPSICASAHTGQTFVAHQVPAKFHRRRIMKAWNQQKNRPVKDVSPDLKRSAESARYALLRRLQPAMRHQMAGGFQPVTMLAAIIEKRLLAAMPDMAALARTSGEVRALSTAATRLSLNLMGWIGSDPAAKVPLDTGVLDALHLVATELSIRGLACVNQTAGADAEVAVNHLRGAFVAGLMALTDAAPLPAKFLLSARREGPDMLLTIELTDEPNQAVATTSDPSFRVNLPIYRKIDWDDVEAIAAADGIVLKRTATSLALHLPIHLPIAKK